MDIKLIQDSWAQIDKEAFAQTFYNMLFALDDSLRSLFPQDLADQEKKLTSMVNSAIALLGRPELLPALHKLGERHKTYGATTYSYKLVGAALLDTIVFLYPPLNEKDQLAVENAWSELYEVISTEMQKG